MEITSYAPVYIPTLNRYEHFKRCLESLERCTWADKTDVYIGLDYPPSEKYVEGWKKIDAYLAEKEKSNGFQNLYVRRRDHNCGVGNPKSNSALLSEEISKKHDSYIFSEDDNEFAPNFLVFMNKCLERFKDDERIIKVCGYNFKMEFPAMYRNNFYISKSSCAWGTGTWVKKRQEMMKYYNLDFLRSILRSNDSYQLLVERSPMCVSLIMSMLKLRQLHGDATWDVYCALEEKYFVLPTVSKTRNYGNDGTGWHSPKMIAEQNEFYSKQEIDTDTDYVFTDDIFTYEPVFSQKNNYKPKKSLKSLYKAIVLKLDVFLLRNFNFVPKSKYI